MSTHSITAAVAATWHALLCVAKNQANRKHLRDGARYRCDLQLRGRVGGRDIDEVIAGSLVVSGPQEKSSSSAVNTAHLVAWLWQQIPSTRRPDLRDALLEHFGQHEEPPAVDNRDLEETKLLLKQLRSTNVKQVQGIVTFELDALADAA